MSGSGEDLPPLHFRAAEHRRYEIPHLIGLRLCRWLFRRGLRLLLRTATKPRQDFRSADQIKRVDAQCPADEPKQDDGAEADPAAAAHGKAARSTSPPIFYLVAARQFIYAHISSPQADLQARRRSVRCRGFQGGAACLAGRARCHMNRIRMAPMVAATRVRMKPNTGIFRMLASTPPTKAPAMPTRILVKML